jgi:hypothetical protein
VRDIVEGFAYRTSCFANETAMMNESWMYVPERELRDGLIVDVGLGDKEFCTGHKSTPNQTVLDQQLAKFQALLTEYDHAGEYNNASVDEVCRTMLSAHTLHEFGFVGILRTTRPAVCNATAPWYDETLCNASYTYMTDFLSRDLFVNTAGGGFKGRAADDENEHGEKCKEEFLASQNVSEWNKYLTKSPGITVEEPDCTINTPIEVFPVPVLKVGVMHENIGESLVADAYRYCGCPFVAGISATMPKYIVSTAAAPSKAGMNFRSAISMKEVLTLMSMLQLGGFHAMTGLTLGINFYYQQLVVTPPFDSGAFDNPNSGGIRCHDKATDCCTNQTKNADGMYNSQAYVNMIQEWEAKVTELWGPDHKSSASRLLVPAFLSIWCGLLAIDVLT